MAKVTGPLMSMDARGSIGKAIVFMAWKGINTVRQFVIPANPNSQDQQTVRGYFSSAVTKYKTLIATDTAAWVARAAGLQLSGYNMFVQKVCNALKDAKVWAVLHGIIPDVSVADVITVDGVSDNAALVHVKVGTAPGVFSQVFDEAAGRVAAGAFTVDCTALVTGTKYYFQVYVTEGAALAGESGEYSAIVT